MEWRIYYEHSTYSSEDGGAEDAPGLGIQAIAIRDEVVGRMIWWRRDFYWNEGGRWYGGDIFGLWDYLARPGFKKVGFGRSVPNALWNDIVKRVLEDPDLPAKSGWVDEEGQP